MTYNARFLWITTSPQRKLCEFYRGLLFGHKNNMFCYYCCCCPLLLSSSLQESSLLRYRRLTTQFQHIVIVWRLFVRDFQYSRRSCWLWNEPKGAFHLSELTGQTIPVVMRILLLIKTFQPDPSNPKYYARRRWFFNKNCWEKPISL